MRDEIPPRLYRATSLRLHTHDVVEVRLDLGYGVHVDQRVRIEGVDRGGIPEELKNPAFHALIMLIGGRTELIVHTGDFRAGQPPPLARVFVDEKIEQPPIGTMFTPAGMKTPRMEVGTFFRWLSKHDYEKDEVLRVIAGNNPLTPMLAKRSRLSARPKREAVSAGGVE